MFISRQHLCLLHTVLTLLQHPQFALSQCLIVPNIEFVLVCCGFDDMLRFFDDRSPVPKLCQLVYFLIHEELTQDWYFDQFIQGLEYRMRLIIIDFSEV